MRKLFELVVLITAVSYHVVGIDCEQTGFGLEEVKLDAVVYMFLDYSLHGTVTKNFDGDLGAIVIA